MNHIFNYTLTDLVDYLTINGGKKYNALQIYEWLYLKKVTTFNAMSNVKQELIAFLNNQMIIFELKITQKQVAKLTTKYLFTLADNNHIEAVLMRHDYGLSVCISSQVGCNMGCAFCESGRLKKQRDLRAFEMVEQILLIEQDVQERISNVVIMGIGEPLDNYDNVLKFIRIINEPKGLAIGARHITISTCGLIPQIKQLMNEDLQINLAISLHAPNNELRSELMNVNKVYNIEALIAVIKEYIAKTNRRITIEYVMIKGINDSLQEAAALVH
ncbi:MAG TPA: 23S rRNA (adenine(2503)-C(2))-methyltransferase RlmN, partial [Bacilli bacterium]|nr:23S rRNA (adenine(2503)-C(2))-methyltransferase RlmN [Bacilli bacterium]